MPSHGPLTDVRVLDLTSVVMGPFATHILASLGAQVTKLETLDGDDMRHVGPMRNPGMGPIFLHANHGKRSLAIDLKAPRGKVVALRLAARSDVMISNIRSQGLARLGLDHASIQAINPGIIHVSCVGFDQEGPYADRPAYDDLIQGASGLAWLTQRYGAGAPGYVPLTVVDRVAGLHAVYAVTAALYERERNGGMGQAVTVPMFETMAQFVLGDHLAGMTFNPPLGEAGYARLISAHRKPYRTSDGFLSVIIYNDDQWRRFFHAIGQPDRMAHDLRFATHGERAANIDVIYEEIGQLMIERTSVQWQTLLDAADIPNMAMNSPADLLANPQLVATGFIRDIDHPTEGPIKALGCPTRWSRTSPEDHIQPAPRLSEHSREILSELGFGDDEILRLIAEGVVQGTDLCTN